MGQANSHDYEVLSATPIGKGAFAEVFKVLYKQKDVRALKKIKVPNKEEKFSAMREAKILYELDHPNLLKAYHFYEDSSWMPFRDKVIGIILEYCDRGCLTKALGTKRLKEDEILDIIKQISHGLAYLHEKGILHRDIKLENILVQTDPEHRDETSTAVHRIKLADLGLSTLLKDKKGKARETHTFAGTRPYMAPEVKRGDQYSYPADIFSLGCILGELITWKRCSTSKNFRDDVATSLNVSDRLRNLATSMMHPNRENRPTIDQVVATIHTIQNKEFGIHAFFNMEWLKALVALALSLLIIMLYW